MLYQGVQSPTAASLGRFGDIPVGLYTGTPNVDVPLLELGDFGLSVDLTYHSSGIKVSDIGGWVGMGWALQSGGVITRTVRGLPDDHTNGYYHTGGETEEAWENILSGGPFSDSAYQEDLTAGRVDGEPDTFFFNIDGRTGQFVVGPNGEADIRTVPDQNLRFEVTEGQPENCGRPAVGGGFTEWQVTTEDGTKYVFADIEMTYQNSGTSRVGQQQYVSAWHLSRIESPSGDNTVHFEYGTGEWVEHDHPVYERSTYPTEYAPDCDMGHDRVNQIQRTCSPVLEKITTRDKEVRFVSGPRDDIDGGHKLEEIKVHDRESGQLSTSFELGYEYYANRLFLSEVQELGADGAQQVPYTFEYDAPGDLPSDRASLAVDHWGYYNGASRNISRNTQIPTQTFSEFGGFGDRGDIIMRETTYEGANRRPDEGLAGRGVLNQINYPTGGYTHLEYEPHDYSMIGNPATEDLFETRMRTLREAAGHDSGAGPPGSNEFDIESFKSNSEAPNDPVVVQVESMFDRGTSSRCRNDCPRVWIYEDGERTHQRYHQEPGSDTHSFSKTLYPGVVYEIRAMTNYEGDYAQIDFRREVEEETSIRKETAGGVRIKRITEHNGLSTEEDVVTEYRYTDPDDDSTSSGVLVNKPIYQTQSPDFPSQSCSYVELSSSSYRGLGSTQGSIVGYGEVQVIHSEHGAVQHSFRDPYEVPDYDVDYVSYPFAPASSADWKRGQEQRRATINSDGAVKTEESFSYNFLFNESQRTYPAIAYKSFITPDYIFSPFVIPHRYEVTSRWVYPTSETVTHVGEDGGEATTTTSYTYEEDPSAPAFMQRRSEEVTTSAGTGRTTTYEYAHEAHKPQMGPGGTHQLSEIYRTTVTNAAEEVLRRSWTTWQQNPDPNGLGWVPFEEWVWTGTE